MNLAALSITGVHRNYGTQQPLSIPSANIPAQFVAFPTADNAPWVATGGASLSQTLRAELYVIAKPIAKGRPIDVSDPLEMLDNVVAALGATTALARSKPKFSVRVTALSFGEGPDAPQYWAIVADVSATG